MMQSKSKKKMGRPKLSVITDDLGKTADKLPSRPIDLRQVFYWMDIGSSQEEIAGSFYVSVDTLSRRLKEETGMTFAELKERCCGAAKIKLRNNQFKLSEKNASMAIWLGKVWLDQKDPDKSTPIFVDKDSLAELFDKTRDPLKKNLEEHQC